MITEELSAYYFQSMAFNEPIRISDNRPGRVISFGCDLVLAGGLTANSIFPELRSVDRLGRTMVRFFSGEPTPGFARILRQPEEQIISLAWSAGLGRQGIGYDVPSGMVTGLSIPLGEVLLPPGGGVVLYLKPAIIETGDRIRNGYLIVED